MSEFTDNIVPSGGSSHQGFARGNVINEVIEADNPVGTPAGRGALEDEVDDSAKPHGTRLDEILAKHVKIAEEDTEATGEEDDPEAGDPHAPKDEPVLVAETAPGVPAIDWKAEIERRDQANAALAAELEQVRKTPAPQSKAKQLLIEAEQGYFDDSNAALRKFLAATLGVDDPNHADVDAEIAGLYTDLTAKELGVTPDIAQQAKREAVRTRQILAREKRERKADETTAADKVKADAESKQAEAAATFIGNRLSAKRPDGRSIADEFPLVGLLAEDLDGEKPESVLWKVLTTEAKTGRLTITADDDANIAAAAKILNTRYQTLADKLAKVQPQTTSTAVPNATTSERKEQRQSHGARTLTTADASVAPAAPPAKKPAATTEQPPKFKSVKERQEWALRRLSK